MDPIALLQKLQLNSVDGRVRDADRRQNGTTILLIHSNDQVTAAPIVEVIREGADGVDDCLRIPPSLALKARPLDPCARNSSVLHMYHGRQTGVKQRGTMQPTTGKGQVILTHMSLRAAAKALETTVYGVQMLLADGVLERVHVITPDGATRPAIRAASVEAELARRKTAAAGKLTKNRGAAA